MSPYSGKVDPLTGPWSSATTSFLVGNYLGAHSRDELENKGFRPNPYASHWTYINDAYQAKEDPTYKYNAYIAEKLPSDFSEVKVGDIFFRGYDTETQKTKNKDYNGFKKLSKQNGYYPSHTDTVVETGIDDKGEYVVLVGGNVRDKLLHQKYYLKELRKKYAGYMQQNPERNFENFQDSNLVQPVITGNTSSTTQDFNPLTLPTFGMAAGGNLLTNSYMNVLAAGGEMTEGDPTNPNISTSANSLTEQEKNLILTSIKKAAPGIGKYQLNEIYNTFFADEDSIPYTRNMLLSNKLDETVQLVLGSSLASKALSGEKPGFKDIVSTLAGAKGDVRTALINMGVPPDKAAEYLKEQARQAGAPEENLGYIDRLGGKGFLNPFNFFDYELPADRPYYSFAAGGNMYAMGGPQDMLTNIENGGTHEENPLGGVPMGPNASVEQGETIQRNTEPGTDFVFSDRLPEKGITKEMAAEYNLPKNMIGKTFASASKTIEKQNHRKHDIIDKNTKDVALARLRDAQEEYKDRAFQEQLAEIEEKFGKSAADMGQQQPSPEEQMMMQQQMQGQAPQPSPEEMMAMQMGMGQEPPQGIPAPQPAMPPQQMAPQMEQGMDPTREAQIRAALQNAYGGPVQMAPGGPTTQDLLGALGQYEQVLNPNGSVDRSGTAMNFARNLYGDGNLQGALDYAQGMMPSGIPYADFRNLPPSQQPADARFRMDPMVPTNQLGAEIPEPPQNLYNMQGFDPVTAFQNPGVNYRVPTEIDTMPAIQPGPVDQAQFSTQMPEQVPLNPLLEVPENMGGDQIRGLFDKRAENELIKSLGAGFTLPPDIPSDPRKEPKTEPFIQDVPMEDEVVDKQLERDLRKYNRSKTNTEGSGENEFQDPFRQGVFADAYAKLLQSIKPIRERNAAAYLINAQYDPINYPIEAQRKAIKDVSSSTRRLLANRMGGSPGLYMAMMGKVNADEAMQTAELFDKKYVAEASDLQNIRQLVNQDSQFNMRIKQLVEELNEKDLQGKEQLALEAANSFAKTYQGLRKESFMKFIGDEYKVLYGLLGGNDIPGSEEDKEEDNKDN